MYLFVCVYIIEHFIYIYYICFFFFLSKSARQRGGPETVEGDRKIPRRRGRRQQEVRSDRRRPTAEFEGSRRSRR